MCVFQLLDNVENKMKGTCVEGTIPKLFRGKMVVCSLSFSLIRRYNLKKKTNIFLVSVMWFVLLNEENTVMHDDAIVGQTQTCKFNTLNLEILTILYFKWF